MATVMAQEPRIVFVCLLGGPTPCADKRVTVPADLSQFLALAAAALQVPCLSKCFLTDGSRLDKLDALRDGDRIMFVADDPLPSTVTTPSMPAMPATATAITTATAASDPGVSPPLTPAAHRVLDPLPTCASGSGTEFQRRATGEVSLRRCVPRESDHDSDWVRLCVGGTTFVTTRATLTRDPDSMLARMFSTDAWQSHTDATGAYLIDRSAQYFEPLLNFLRHGTMVLNRDVSPKGVLEEAMFFNVAAARTILERMVEDERLRETDQMPLSRGDLIRMLLLVPATQPLRCQGLNFEGADLSRLDLRHANFKFANLRGCNLSHCNLEMSIFECANMQGVVLDGANLMGCQMSRACLEGASLRACNFNDPSRCTFATLEGANLRGADLEDSNLSCVNLRVAILKGATLVNCDLRSANLAGSDLENCDLTGCTLVDANLRGANTVGTRFANLLQPLHMSQSVPSHMGPTLAS